MSHITAVNVMQAIESAHKAGFLVGTSNWCAHVAEQLDPRSSSGYCNDYQNCMCGGDTKGVRETCSNWVKP